MSTLSWLALAPAAVLPSPCTRPPVTYPPPPCGRQNADRAGRACAGWLGCHRGAAAVWGPQSVTPARPPGATGIQLRARLQSDSVKILLPRAEPSSGSCPTTHASPEPFVNFRLSSGLLSPPPQEGSQLLGICPAYHAQGGQPPHQQPEEVEEGMKVDVVGDEQDNAVPKEAIALGRRGMARKISQVGLASRPSWEP